MRCAGRLVLGLLLTAGLFQGCGSEAEVNEAQDVVQQEDVKHLACGEGTVEQNGFCVPEGTDVIPVPEDVVEQDTQTPNTLKCGPGTIEVDGECLLDDKAVEEMMKPEVVSVKLVALTVSEEGLRPLYPMHPMHLNIGLEVETWDELDTAVVVGLESADGSKRCIAGYAQLTLAPQAKTDEGPEVQAVTLTPELYVQPACEALVGQTGVKAWVSFDPFGHTLVAGRTLTVSQDITLLEFLQQSRLLMTDCKSEATAHPDSCETALELQASPGRDVVLTSSQLSSSVAVLEIPLMVPEYIETSVTDDEGNVIELQQPDPIKPLSTSPHFIVNANMRVFGLDGTEADQVDDGALSLNFAIRPLVQNEDGLEVSPELDMWMPLYAEIQDEPKAGEEPTINLLEQEFMKSMAGSQELSQTSPIFISGDTELFIASGIWAGFDQFELRVCVGADFEEGGVDQDAQANNCAITPVVILRKPVDENVIADEAPGATKWTDGIKLGDTYGNPDKVAIKFSLNGELISADDGAAAGALLGAYLKGWFEMTLFEATLRGWDYYNPSTPDKIIPSLTVFGITMPSPSLSFPEGETEVAGKSFTLSSPSVRYGFDLGIVFVGISAHAEGTIGAGAYLEREVVSGSSGNPKCNVAGAIAVGNYCVKVFNTLKGAGQAAEACRNDAGWIASVPSVAVANAILQARTAAGATNAYLWVEGGMESCTQLGAMKQYECDTMYSALLQIAKTVPQMAQQAEQFKTSCEMTKAKMLEECNARRQDMSTWRWIMPQVGSVATSEVKFATGQPDDASPGEPALALKAADSKFYDMAAGSLLPYACMYPKSFTAGGKVSAVVEPYATLTLVGKAGISLLLVGADLWVAVDLLTAALPLTGSVQWMAGVPILTLATGTLEFVLRGLGGAIGATLWAKPGGEWTITIFDWDSIDYGRWTLGSLVPKWRSH